MNTERYRREEGHNSYPLECPNLSMIIIVRSQKGRFPTQSTVGVSSLKPKTVTRESVPCLPVGGRLQAFVQNWTEVTKDKWILQVVQEGLKTAIQGISKGNRNKGNKFIQFSNEFVDIRRGAHFIRKISRCVCETLCPR